MALPVNVAPEYRLLSSEAIANLRALNEANMPHRCSATMDVKTGTRVGGALTTTPTSIMTNVPCRLAPVKRRIQETLQGDQANQQDQWMLVFRVGVAVPEHALATITGTDALGVPWTRVVRVGTPVHSRAFEIRSAYSARDVNVAGR